MKSDKAEFWEESYKNGIVGWNLKSATPTFVDLLDHKLLKDKKTLLVLGCGYGYDAIAAAKFGFDVTANDFSETAIKFAKDLARKESVKINFLLDDLFSIDENQKFDIVYDYVTYCAVNPQRRKEYADKVASLINKNGIFAIILFPIEDRIGGPPFAVDVDEVEKLFGARLELVLSTDKIKTINPRKGRELLQIYRKIK
ncbi:MAG: methyltransferase domain-containing protein [Ignavibacteriales bacterium]|nr:methyltransferase domain-containing protein [Ignavibacteriales bacterium]